MQPPVRDHQRAGRPQAVLARLPGIRVSPEPIEIEPAKLGAAALLEEWPRE